MEAYNGRLAIERSPETYEMGGADGTGHDPRHGPPSDDRLESWKEIAAYLKRAVSFKSAKGERCAIEFVGKKVSAKEAWLHFQVKLPGGLAGVEINHRLFLRVFSGQVNTLNLRDGDRRHGFCGRRYDRGAAGHLDDDTGLHRRQRQCRVRNH